MLYRGFSYLHSRVLLDLQDELACLERELDRADLIDENNGHGTRLRCRERDERDARKSGLERTRRDILLDIRHKLCEYGKQL
jgi:hypothetical protein